MTRIPQFSVCQDCGQAWPLQLLDTDNNCLPGRCPQCAGQTCDCPFCLENAAQHKAIMAAVQVGAEVRRAGR